MQTGNIIVRRDINTLGRLEATTYQWNGGPVTHIDFRDLPIDHLQVRKKGWFQMGPYKLKILEIDYSRALYKCIRIDYPFWRAFAFFHHANRYVRIISARIIISLAVWGLAEYKNYLEPSCQDVYIIKNIKKIFRNKNVSGA